MPLPGARVSAVNARPGDAVLLSGPIGLHGITILADRDELGFDTEIASDSQPLHDLVAAMISAAGTDIHALRDPTRGGVANEGCLL
ncbi:MAG TPA: AIR synthase-related protein, partial [Pseudonocardiaceae bacterium]|nr:AIR synthase-related protein [Pseudonocardiaceae bacterium]